MKTRADQSINYEKIVLENLSDVIVVTDLDGRVRLWNALAEKYYAIPQSDALGKNIADLVRFNYPYFSDKEALAELQDRKQWQGKVSFTNERGQTFYLLQNVKYLFDKKGKEIALLWVGNSITEKLSVTKKVQDNAQFYKALIADSLDTILLMNADGTITFASPGVKALLGFEVDKVIGTNGFSYIHPDDFGYAIESFEKEIEEKPEIKFIVIRLLKENGEWVWCMVRGHNLLNNPAINSIAVYIHDDTQHKKASDALKESEKRFRSLIRDLRIGVLLQDAQGKIIMTNNSMINLFGMNEEEILGGKIWELYTDVIHENGRHFLLNERPSYQAFQSLRPVQDVVMGVWNKSRKERIWIMISADPILDNDGKLLNVVSSFADITERKKLEKKSFGEKMAYQRQITQATIDGQEKERLEIGTELHDNVGQQLTTIKLLLDLAKTSANAETKEMINTALNGVSDVINEVRAISRSLVPPTLKDLGFIDSVNDLIDALRTVQSISIDLDYFGFDEDQLPENKKLALFRIIQEQLNNITRHAKAQNVWINLTFTEGHILLRIKDNGNGFDLRKIRRGLGLTNIINRAELFGGRVEINTSPGAGCKIKVWIPHSVTSQVF